MPTELEISIQESNRAILHTMDYEALAEISSDLLYFLVSLESAEIEN